MFWFFVSRLGSAAITLLVLVLLTRLLGPEDFGRYNILTLAATIAYGVLFAWLGTGIIRFNAAPEFGGRALSGALGTGGALCVLLAPPVLAASLWLGGGTGIALAVGAAYCVTHGLHEIAIAGLRVQQAGPAFAVAMLVRPVLGVALSVVLVLLGYGYAGGVLGMALGAGAAGAVALWIVLRRSEVGLLGPAALRRFLAFGFPLGIVASGSMIVVLVSQLLLARFASLEQVGIFAAAYTIAMRAIAMPMMTLAMSADATIFEEHERSGGDASGAALRRYASFLFLVSVPVTAVLALSGGTVARVLFDPAFSPDVARHLPILAIAAFVMGLQGAYFGFSFTISRRSWLQLAMTLGIICLHAPVTALLVTGFGAVGASAAMLITAVAAAVLYASVGGRVHRVVLPGDELRKMTLAVLAAAPLLTLADMTASVWVAIGLVCAGLVAFTLALLIQRHAGLLIAGNRVLRRIRA